MNIQDDVNSLHSYESFARFIKMVHELREEAISEMHESSSETIQQISGRIITYDQILQISGWDKLRLKHSDRM